MVSGTKSLPTADKVPDTFVAPPLLPDWEANYGTDPDLLAATSAVPESATLVLFGVGLGGLGVVSRRRIPQSL